MTAELKPRIDFDNRTKLETVIPLSTPYLIFLDPSDICNAKCRWCPTGSGEALKYKKPQLMEKVLYKKIIDGLCDMPEKIKTLRLYKDGEPLLNPYFPQMVKYAKDSGRFGQIDTTTNGTLLTPKKGYKIVGAGLDKIFISVPNDYDQEYVDRVRNFYLHRDQCLVYVKIIGDGMSCLDKEMFYNDFGTISDRIFIENLAPCWPGFDVGKVGEKGIYNQEIKGEPMVCSYIFYSLSINSDGTVSLCFLDWKRDMILGDLKKESFKDIWNGWKLHAYRTAHLRKLRKEVIVNCHYCGQLSHGAPDDIDQYADEILRRLT